jgi:hypothetical protein
MYAELLPEHCDQVAQVLTQVEAAAAETAIAAR